LSNNQVVSEAVSGAKYVYHLAGVADIDEAVAKPRETVIQNIIGSINVIEACIKAGVEKLLYASTVYVYSDKGSFYRVSKQAVELLLSLNSTMNHCACLMQQVSLTYLTRTAASSPKMRLYHCCMAVSAWRRARNL